jgi:uncharacterized protein involved in type VI secretion and phage assembly
MPEEGKRLTRMRIQEEEVYHHKVSGTGSFAGFDAGRRFTLMPDRQRNGKKPASYLLTEVRHTARDTNYFSTETAPATYSNRFVCIPVETPFRPERLTDRPTVQGPQTATVVGPAGENIHTDQYGRVRLLFHWDRLGKRDEHASCWIRVSQVSAGSHWGSLAIPHVGQEVIVAFLEGDPDRPIVTGHVHNGDNMPPLNLPRDKHKTVIRDNGDNRIIMHGRPGHERLSMVSPKNINIVAMRSAAKPLSAQTTIDNISFDDYEDPNAMQDLLRVYQQLAFDEGKSSTPPAKNKQGTYFTTPDGTPASPQAADEGASIDINTLTETNLNSLSVLNTNGWVGQDLNSWVNRDSNSQVNRNSSTIIHGKSTTQIDKDASTTVHGNNNTFVSGNNTQVFAGTNDQAVFGLNTGLIFGGSVTLVLPMSVQLFAGLNAQLTAGLNFQSVQGLNLQYANLNVQKFELNVQHNVMNISWDEHKIVTAEAKVEDFDTVVAAHSSLWCLT